MGSVCCIFSVILESVCESLLVFEAVFGVGFAAAIWVVIAFVSFVNLLLILHRLVSVVP